MTTVSKACKRCNSVKPLSDFYVRSGMSSDSLVPGHYITECKECMKARSAGKKGPRPKAEESLIESENLAIREMKQRCIFAQTGRASSAPDVDVTAWGLVFCECKHAKLIDGAFQFRTTIRQQRLGFRAHVAILICEWEPGKCTFHILPADHPAFMLKDGKAKTGIDYRPHRMQPRGRKPALSDELMNMYRDNWQLIEETRLRLAAALPYDAKPIMQLVNNPTVKLVPMAA